MCPIIGRCNVSLCLGRSLPNPPFSPDTPYEAVFTEIEDIHSARNEVAESLVNLRKSQPQPVGPEGVMGKCDSMLKLRPARLLWRHAQMSHRVLQIDSLGGLILGCYLLGNTFIVIFNIYARNTPGQENYTPYRKTARPSKPDLF